MNISVEDFFGFKCNYRYCTDNNCIGRVCAEANLDNVFAQRRALWGPKESKEPTTKERGDRLFALQQKCWDASQRKFVYLFRAAFSSKATTVCENAYLFLLGYKKDPITGNCRSGQFIDNKKRIQNNQGWRFVYVVISCYLFIFFRLQTEKLIKNDPIRQGSSRCIVKHFFDFFVKINVISFLEITSFQSNIVHHTAPKSMFTTNSKLGGTTMGNTQMYRASQHLQGSGPTNLAIWA